MDCRTLIKFALLFITIPASLDAQIAVDTSRVFCGHEVQLDNERRLLPRKTGDQNPYDHFLRLRWNFVKTRVPGSPGPAPRSSFPQYFFYCAFIDSAGHLLPDPWMNDVGEKIPMWIESARLYRDYSGDDAPLRIAKNLADYSMEHGIAPADYSWPHFPQTAADAGALEFRGFTGRFSVDDVHVDHGGDIGATYYKMFLLFDDQKYRQAAIRVADVLAAKVSKGSATHSPWPYMVNAKSGEVVSEYGTNWFGCIRLLNMLIEHGEGNVQAYRKTLKTVTDWLLQFPFENGIWVDGHTDTYITGRSNLSNLSASNAGLYLSDHPEFTAGWKRLLPSLIKWTEDNFVFKAQKGEPSQMWGANIVSEQVAFMPKMDYQTARYAAQCAKWYQMGGGESYKEKAYRAINFVTYCNDTSGKAFESPFSKGVNSWWSDSYGECPIMFYHTLAAIPEWAPHGEDHLLYSSGIVAGVSYADGYVAYRGAERSGTESFRLRFKPASIRMNGRRVYPARSQKNGVEVKPLPGGDYSVTIRRTSKGDVEISAKDK